jgi:hypothetical protein
MASAGFHLGGCCTGFLFLLWPAGAEGRRADAGKTVKAGRSAAAVTGHNSMTRHMAGKVNLGETLGEGDWKRLGAPLVPCKPGVRTSRCTTLTLTSGGSPRGATHFIVAMKGETDPATWGPPGHVAKAGARMRRLFLPPPTPHPSHEPRCFPGRWPFVACALPSFSAAHSACGCRALSDCSSPGAGAEKSS